LQILSSVNQLPIARRSQYAALIRDEGVLVVWADSVDALIPTTQALEKSLIEFIRSGRRQMRSSPSSVNILTTQLETPLEVPEAQSDPEKAVEEYKARPQTLISAFTCGLAMTVLMVLVGLGMSESRRCGCS
jgi:hypothetical protein